MKFLLSHVFLFIVLIQQSVFAAYDLIHDTCKQTPYKKLCVDTLEADRRSYAVIDEYDLAVLMVSILSLKSSYALDHVEKLLKDVKSPESRKALLNCGEDYNAVKNSDLPLVREGLRTVNPKLVEKGGRDCATRAESCEKGFAVEPSPITDMNKEFHDLSVIAASIGHLIK